MTTWDDATERALDVAAAYERSGEVRLLDRAIDLFREVVEAGDGTVPDRARHLDNLGVALLTRFEAANDRRALRHALTFARRATTEGPGRHPDHALHLSNFSNTVLAWFDETGEVAVLDEGVAAGAAAVRLAVGDEHELLIREVARAAAVRRFEYDVARAVAYGASFDRTSSADDLALAVAAGRAAITGAPTDERRRWTAWSNLSNLLRLRFELHGSDDDLDEAVDLARTAISLAENGGAPVPDNPDPLSSCTVNLAAALLARFFATGTVTDADEVIEVCRPVAGRDATPPDTRHLLLSHVVGALQERGRRSPRTTAGRGDLDDAVAIGQLLVAHADTADRGRHLANLANSLLTRDGDGDLAAAIGHADEALRLLSRDTQEWARAAATHAFAHRRRRWLVSAADADAGVALEELMSIASSTTVSVEVRIGAARDAADLAVRSDRPALALDAARTAVALLPVVAWRGISRGSRAARLARWPEISLDAAPIAAREEPHTAATVLEHGRSVLWAQTLDARREPDRLRMRDPALADRLARVRDALDRDPLPGR